MRALLLLALLLAAAPVPAAVIHVRADAAVGGDGTTWASAFRLLSAGLGAAQAGDQVWVAQGTYVPGASRRAYFQVPDGVEVYGGFQGFETALDQRTDDPGLTVLSGEIGDAAEVSDNSSTIAVLLGDGRLDTLTVTGGYGAVENNSYSFGIVQGSTATRTFARVCFRANQKAAILRVYGSTTLRGCEFLANGIADYQAVLNLSGSLAITGCVFAGNGSVGDSVGPQRVVCSLKGSGRIDNTVFANNVARAVLVDNNWGAATLYERYQVALVACTFVGNGLDYRPPASEDPFIGYYPAWFYGRAYACILDTVQASQPAAGALNWDVAVRGDPGFVDAAHPAGVDGRWFSADDGLRLAAEATARAFVHMDAGAADGVADLPATDAIGTLRPQGGNPEPGAYEIDAGEGNRTPVAVAVRLSTREDTDLRVPLAGSDADGDPLTARLLSLPAHGALYPTSDGAVPSGPALAVGAVIANAQVLYRPAPDDFGSQRGDFTFLVNDGSEDSPASLAVIDVRAVNDAPVASLADAVTLTQGATPLDIIGIVAGGGESQAITISAQSGDPALLAVAVDYTSPASIGRLVLTPQAGMAGSTTVAVTVADDGGTAEGGIDRIVRTLAVTVVMMDAVEIPVQWVGTVIGVARPFILAASHPFSPSLVWSIAAQPAHGAITVTDAAAGSFTLAPIAGFSGEDAFAVIAQDGLGNRGSATVAITVTGFAASRPQPAGDPPRRIDGGATLTADVPWQATGASLRFTLVGALPAGIQVTGSARQARIEGLPELSGVADGVWLRGGLLAEDPDSRSTGWLPLLLRASTPPQGRN